MIKINKNLTTFSLLFIVLATLLFFSFQKLFPLIGHVTYYCQSMLVEARMIPIPYFLTAIPFAILLLILTVSLIKFLSLSIKVQILKIRLRRDKLCNTKINKLLFRIGLQNKAMLVNSNKRFAFCLGVRRPMIYFSTGLVSELSLEELESVLRHEQYHLEKNDTFTMIVGSVAYSLFPFFPFIGDLINKYRVDREIEADRFSVEKIRNKNILISALKKLLAYPTMGITTVSAIADKDTLEPRIYTLINKPYKKRRISVKNVFFSLISCIVLIAIFVFPVHAKELHHEDHDVVMLCADGNCQNSCADKNNLEKFYSEIPSSNKSSQPQQLFTPMH